MSDTVLRVEGAAPYDVVIGTDLADRLPAMLGEASAGRRRLRQPAGRLVKPVLAALGTAYDVTVLPIPDGERAKGVEVAAACWDALGEAGFTRSDAIVTFGGGATTDLGGFVAATWLRGVRVVHVPPPCSRWSTPPWAARPG